MDFIRGTPGRERDLELALLTDIERFMTALGKGWPHTPPNYIGFRFDGRLQQVRHVDRYEVVTRPHDYIPEIIPQADWTDEPHFLYTLGPPIVPAKPVLNGKIWPNARLWCALDLLLTCDTISEARDKTQERMASAGEAAA